MVQNWIDNWLRDAIVPPIIANLQIAFGGLEGVVNLDRLSQTPEQFNPFAFAEIYNIANGAIMSVAGLILAYVLSYEFIQMLLERNNMRDFETFMLYKWMVKCFIAVVLMSNVFTITNAIFTVSQDAIQAIDSLDHAYFDAASLDAQLRDMPVGNLFNVFMMSFMLALGAQIMGVALFFIIYGRMFTIYLKLVLAPIPFATFVNKDWQSIGMNYVKSICAVAFQAVLMVVVIRLYGAVATPYIQQTINGLGVAGLTSSTISWAGIQLLGLWILLIAMLFKTGSIANSIFGAS